MKIETMPVIIHESSLSFLSVDWYPAEKYEQTTGRPKFPWLVIAHAFMQMIINERYGQNGVCVYPSPPPKQSIVYKVFALWNNDNKCLCIFFGKYLWPNNTIASLVVYVCVCVCQWKEEEGGGGRSSGSKEKQHQL